MSRVRIKRNYEPEFGAQVRALMALLRAASAPKDIPENSATPDKRDGTDRGYGTEDTP